MDLNVQNHKVYNNRQNNIEQYRTQNKQRIPFEYFSQHAILLGLTQNTKECLQNICTRVEHEKQGGGKKKTSLEQIPNLQKVLRLSGAKQTQLM